MPLYINTLVTRRNFDIWHEICTPHHSWHSIWHRDTKYVRLREFLRFDCFLTLFTIFYFSLLFFIFQAW